MGTASRNLSVLSLFTGAGGLDLGLEAAGFKPVLCVESDEDARATLRRNRPAWRLSEPGDIHQLPCAEILRQARLKPRQLTLLAGGPPCQPFSQSMYWTTGDAPRLKDPRARTLSAYLEVVRATLPKLLLLENVKGLAFEGKDEGIKLLERGLRTINREHSTSYVPQIIPLNAANYGVPQFRERIFVVAHIDGQQFKTPDETHGAEPGREPFLTAWDAIGDLDKEVWPDELNATGRWAELLPSIPEGRNYLWHTRRTENTGASHSSAGGHVSGLSCLSWQRRSHLGQSKPYLALQRGLFIGRVDCFLLKNLQGCRLFQLITKFWARDAPVKNKSAMPCRPRLANCSDWNSAANSLGIESGASYRCCRSTPHNVLHLKRRRRCRYPI